LELNLKFYIPESRLDCLASRKVTKDFLSTLFFIISPTTNSPIPVCLITVINSRVVIVELRLDDVLSVPSFASRVSLPGFRFPSFASGARGPFRSFCSLKMTNRLQLPDFRFTRICKSRQLCPLIKILSVYPILGMSTGVLGYILHF
jgi:hypothetical protein